jgi:branched-chain amino acid transport system permease protein
LAAGGLAAPLTSVYPNMGDGLLIVSFVVVVIGGFGSVSGAFWAALLVGLIDTLGKAYGSAFSGAAAGGLAAALPAMSIYMVMILVLVLRPSGLFGGRS